MPGAVPPSRPSPSVVMTTIPAEHTVAANGAMPYLVMSVRTSTWVVEDVLHVPLVTVHLNS